MSIEETKRPRKINVEATVKNKLQNAVKWYNTLLDILYLIDTTLKVVQKNTLYLPKKH